MPLRFAARLALAWFVCLYSVSAVAESGHPITLSDALRRALAANPRLTAAEKDVRVAAGHRHQAGAFPNPQASFEVDNAFGSGELKGLEDAETTLQISQLIELGGKREARIAAGSAEVDAARWERAAVRLEIVSKTAVAFFDVLTAQRRIQIYNDQIAALDRLTPLLQKRVDAGASSPAEVARARVAVDLVRVDRERAVTASSIARRELAIVMGVNVPDFSRAVGDLNRVGAPPAFQTVLKAIDINPQLMRWSAVWAQRDAELLIARLKPIPDVQVFAGWRHFNQVWNGTTFEANDNAVRLGLSVPLPVWDQNIGGIEAARESLSKVQAERASNRLVLVLTLGRAYDTLVGAGREIDLLRTSTIPNARTAVDGMESGYREGRYTLLELLDVESSSTQASLRELDALLSFHISVAIIEGLTGAALKITRGRQK
jgi:cobalt-zinc-cadmium efflux system outer membrane protein